MCDSVDRTEALCHLDGMLDRDQRTAVTCRFRDRSDDSLAGEGVRHGCPCVPHPHNRPDPDRIATRSRSRKQRWSYRVARRFKEVLVVGVYILSLIHIPARTWGAPATHRLREKRSSNEMDDRMNSIPKWTIPCGVGGDDALSSSTSSSSQDTDADLIGPIVIQADIALEQAKNFRDSYVKDTFNIDFNRNHEQWKSQKYPWLPSIPKNLGEDAPKTHVENIDLSSSLLDAYEHLQKIAAGLEQVVWDMHDNNVQAHRDFVIAEAQLRIVLCEIQYAIQQKRLTPREDVGRNVMTKDFREMSNSTQRNVRDWLIFRDYMNLLEYVIQVFEHFKE